MRILLVSEALVLGGAETFVLRLARRLRQDGHDAQLLCLNPDLDDPRLVGMFDDLPIHRVPYLGLRTLKRLDRVSKWLGLDLELQQRRTARWIKRNRMDRFDVHHTHLFGADLLFARLKRDRPDLTIVSTLHGDYALYQGKGQSSENSRILNWNAKLRETLRAVDRWVTISPAQHRQFTELFGVDPDRLLDIPNGYVPPAQFVRPRPRNDAKVRFVMVARGMREKGWGFLIDAFLRLDGDRSLLLIGEGAYLDLLRSKHSADPRICFAGSHPNPVELIAAADVFVHPSIYPAESMPTVIVEALFAGLPVIATDIGSVRGMIATPSGELAGTLVAADETTLVGELAATMRSYLDDPALRRRHAALATAAFAKFDMATCAAAYARVYAEAMEPGAFNSSIKANH